MKEYLKILKMDYNLFLVTSKKRGNKNLKAAKNNSLL